MRVTDEQITAGLALAAKASPGPWEWDSEWPESIMSADGDELGKLRGNIAFDPPALLGENAQFAAHAGTHYGDALRELQELRAAAREAEEHLAMFYSSAEECGCPECKQAAEIGHKLRTLLEAK